MMISYKTLRESLETFRDIPATYHRIWERLTRIQAAVENRVVPRFPCGIIMYGEITPTSPQPRYTELRDLDSISVIPDEQAAPPELKTKPTIQSATVLLGPNEEQSVKLQTDVRIQNLSFAAVGPCSIISLRVANKDLNCFASGQGTSISAYADIVHPANLILIRLKAWEW